MSTTRRTTLTVMTVLAVEAVVLLTLWLVKRHFSI
jgi:hypothetical protein